MKIAVDTQSAHGSKSGIGMFADAIAKVFVANYPTTEFLFYQPQNNHDLRTHERILWESHEIQKRIRRDKPDLIYFPGFSPSVHSAVPQVITVHDLIGMKLKSNQRGFARFYWSFWQPFALKQANFYTASSECTKRDMVSCLGISAERIEVVPLFARPWFKDQPVKNSGKFTSQMLDKPFFLTPSALEPRKNHLAILRAYLQSDHRNQFRLIFAGKDAGEGSEIQRFVRENKLEDSVYWTGYVTDEELKFLYQNALAVVMVSHYEGFGLPVLEGMHCGVPSIVSNNSSLPEISGDSGIEVSATDVGAIAQAMRTLLTNSQLRTELSQKAIRRAALFTPEKTAASLMAIFQRAARKRSRT